MYHWYPKTKLENAVVGCQPNHDFIFGKLSEKELELFTNQHPKSHLDYAEKNQQKSNLLSNPKLDVIMKVQRITGVKSGELPSVNDWETFDTLEQETIGMIRHLGLEPSTDIPFNKSCTIPTHPIPNDIEFMKSGNRVIPIFFNKKYFKFQPRKNIDFISIEHLKDNTNTEEAIEKNLNYSPILDVTTTEKNSAIDVSAIQYKELKDVTTDSETDLIGKSWSYGIFGNNIGKKKYNSKKQKSQKMCNNDNVTSRKKANCSTSESSYETEKSTVSEEKRNLPRKTKNLIPKQGRNTNPLCGYNQLYTPKEIYHLKRRASSKDKLS